MTEFNDKCVLVTGGSRGVGRQTAIAFGQAGANVVVNYLSNMSEAKKVESEIISSGGEAFSVQADISDSTQVNAMVDDTNDRFGEIDILINSAGLSRDGPFLEMSEQDWDQVHAVNLKGAFLVCQSVARQMAKSNGGVIVNVSATSAARGRANGANYCCSKAGLNMLTRCMALELGPSIRVNGVGLGFVEHDGVVFVVQLFQPENISLQIFLAIGTHLRRHVFPTTCEVVVEVAFLDITFPGLEVGAE